MLTPRMTTKIDEAFREYGHLPFLQLLNRVHREYPDWVEKVQ